MIEKVMIFGDTFNEMLIRLADKLNADILGLTATVSNNQISLSGKIFNSPDFTNKATNFLTLTPSQVMYYIDKENNFLCIAQGVNGLIPSGTTSFNDTLGNILYCEAEDGTPFSYVGGNNICPAANTPPAYINTNFTSSVVQYITNINFLGTGLNSSFLNTESYELSPVYIGALKIKNLFASYNDLSVVGQKISDGSNEYMCIGCRFWYRMD